MSHENSIRAARDLIWRNLPDHPATFSPCPSCGASGRGGGPCIECATVRLGKLIGEEKARHYVSAVRHIRKLEEDHK